MTILRISNLDVLLGDRVALWIGCKVQAQDLEETGCQPLLIRGNFEVLLSKHASGAGNPRKRRKSSQITYQEGAKRLDERG